MIPRETIEMLEATVTMTVDPTTAAVDWAFPLTGSRPTVWHVGAWDGAASAVQSNYQAVTVSPQVGATGSGADVELAPGVRHDMFVRVTDLSEQAVRSVGVLVLT